MKRKMEREEYWHWFHSLTGIGQKEKEELLKLCPDVEAWYTEGKKGRIRELSGPVYEESQIGKNRKQQVFPILENRENYDKAQKSYENAKKMGIKMVCRESEQYPERLKNIYLPPMMLYYFGELPKENTPSLAVIGARNCSVYGEEIASGFSARLSAGGIQIISGMARGIDSAAQRAAIKERGRAYAVLGSGADVCYPRENKLLYTALCEGGGVISEELPGTEPAS